MVGTHSPGARHDPGQAAAALILIMVIMLRSERAPKPELWGTDPAPGAWHLP